MSDIALPDAWCLAHIDDIAEVKGGKRLPKGESFSDHKTDHPYLRVTDFTAGSIDQSKLKYISDITHAKISLYTISKDDLYISIAGTIGQVGVIPQDLDGANLTENAAKICNIYYLDKGYLAKLLNSEYSKQQFIDNTVSSGQPKLALFRIKECSLPIAPLAEQKEIAARLDNLLAQVDSIKTRLDSIPTILKRFRQSVFAAAVSGRLTEEWRANDSGVWQDVTLKDVAICFSYGTSSKSAKEGKVPVLRMGNLQSGKLDWSDLVYTSDEKEIEKYRLIAGDVLFNRTNSPELVGKTSIYRGEREAIYAGYLIKVQCGEGLKPEFLNIQLNSPYAKDYCRQVKSDGVSQSNINAKKLAAYPFRLPPTEEQTEIVRRVEQLFTFADQIEQRVKDAQSRVNNLTQSILAKAFRGELTADWREHNPDLISGENSAEALLERIKTEREAMQPKRKIRAKKPA